MVVMSPIQKPVIIAESSAHALTRHQNQRKISTTPGPVPMAMTSRKTVATSSATKAAAAPKMAMMTDAMRPIKTSSR